MTGVSANRASWKVGRARSRGRLRALRVAFGNVPSEASPLRCMSSASRRLVLTSPMTSPLAILCQCCCVNNLPSLKETPTLAYDGVRGIMPFPERIVINWIHRLLRVELAVTPSFVVSPSVAELKPCNKNDECRDKQCRQNARTDQQLLHLESFLSDLRPFRDQKESSSFFAPHFIAGGFIPAFARCCFCIAANLLVFTRPISTKFNPWIFLPNTH